MISQLLLFITNNYKSPQSLNAPLKTTIKCQRLAKPSQSKNVEKSFLINVQKYKTVNLGQEELMQQRKLKENDYNKRQQYAEHQYEKWAEEKLDGLNVKLDKVQKNKEVQISKIVKRCQQRDKMVTKKQEDCKMAKKKSLNLAWKKAEKFNDEMKNYYESKQSYFRNKTSTPNSISHHLEIETKAEQTNNNKIDNPISTTQNKLFLTQNINTYQYKVPQITQVRQTLSRSDKFPRTTTPSFYDNFKEFRQSKNKDHTSEILDKFKTLSKLNEDIKIQELGEKMQKIQLTRSKRKQLNQKKPKQNSDRQRNLTQTDFRNSRSPNKAYFTPKQEERLHSQQTWKRQSKIKDRSSQVKQKREEIFEQHLAEGKQYLENVKVRHLKNVITKTIAYRALEKKLFIERLKS